MMRNGVENLRLVRLGHGELSKLILRDARLRRCGATS